MLFYKDRPKVKANFEIIDKIIEVIALSVLAFMCVYVVVMYKKLPNIIATHFNDSGKANGFGNKSTLFLLPGIAIVINILLTILSFYPHIFNYTVKITEENASNQYTLATRFLRIIKCFVNILLLYIVHTSIQTAFTNHAELGKYFLPFILVFMFVPTISYIFFSYKKK